MPGGTREPQYFEADEGRETTNKQSKRERDFKIPFALYFVRGIDNGLEKEFFKPFACISLLAILEAILRKVHCPQISQQLLESLKNSFLE